ncbi:MAG: hypothetical protein C4326_06140 [Ignavibacteria bacterium]
MMTQKTIERRNFILNVVEGALFASSGPLLSAQTVLPALVARLGGSNVAVGSLGLVMWMGLFLPQIFAARHVEMVPWKKPWAIGFGMAQRMMVLLMGFAVLLFGDRTPSHALTLFFLFYTLNQLLLGVTTPGWFDLFAKLTPMRKRGRLIGIRGTVGGLGALMCGTILTWLLAHEPFPINFTFVFALAFLLQSMSVFVQSFLIEVEPSPVVTHHRSLAMYVRELVGVLRTNKPFSTFLVAASVNVLAVMPAGFYTVYALHVFPAPEAIVGTFTLAMVVAQVSASLVTGFLTDKYGNKTALVVASFALLVANLWSLLVPSVELFVIVYVFLGVNLGTELLARYNIAVEYAPASQRATYVGLMNTLIAPFYAAGVMGGVLSTIFGYRLLFWIGLAASAVGVWMMIVKVKEPRTQDFTMPAK